MKSDKVMLCVAIADTLEHAGWSDEVVDMVFEAVTTYQAKGA